MRLDRIEKRAAVLVEVINCIKQPDLNDTALSCHTVDVSEHGIKMTSTMEIPVNTLVGIRLDLAENLYRLQGEVRWSQEDGEFHFGLLLSEEESPDFNEWTKMFQLDF